MTQFSQTSRRAYNKRGVPCPKKGDFNYYPEKKGVLKVKGSDCIERDVVLDRELETFNVTNSFGITNQTTIVEALEILTTNVPTDINQLTDVDGLLHEVIPTTYQNLIDLRDASELEIGKRYAIWDYVPVWNIFDGGTMNIEEYQPGIGEILIVTAASLNSIYKEAISVDHPTDTIYYSLDLIDDRDIGFGDGAGTPIAIFKGMIYYRKDTIQNVETHYDFRNVKFRRWAVDAELFEAGQYAYYTGYVDGMTTDITLTADTIGVIGSTISLIGDGVKTVAVLVSDWNTANPANTVTLTAGDDTQVPSDTFYMTLDDGVDPIAYVAKDVCKSGVDGRIYKCITATTGEDDPTVNTADWILWLDITADAFVSWTSNKIAFNIGDITIDNLIINNVTAGVDYKDFYTFGDYYNWVNNVNIGTISIAEQIETTGYLSILNNNIFKSYNDQLYVINLTLKDNCFNNLFIGSVDKVTIGYGYSKNIINTVYNSCFKNNIFSNIFKNIENSNIENSLMSCFITSLQNSYIGNYNIGLTIISAFSITIKNKISEGGSLYFRDTSVAPSPIKMCNFEDNCFGTLVTDINLSTATHVYGDYNCTIYQDKTLGVRLSYLDNNVITYAAVTD